MAPASGMPQKNALQMWSDYVLSVAEGIERKGGGGVMILHGGALSSLRPDTVRDNRVDHEVHEGRMQTGRRTAYAGSRL